MDSIAETTKRKPGETPTILRNAPMPMLKSLIATEGENTGWLQSQKRHFGVSVADGKTLQFLAKDLDDLRHPPLCLHTLAVPVFAKPLPAPTESCEHSTAATSGLAPHTLGPNPSHLLQVDFPNLRTHLSWGV